MFYIIDLERIYRLSNLQIYKYSSHEHQYSESLILNTILLILYLSIIFLIQQMKQI